VTASLFALEHGLATPALSDGVTASGLR
jgi:hypothetical protein